MSVERQAWLLFVGLLIASLGLSLVCDAEDQAAAVTDWSPTDEYDDARGLAKWYRAAGAAFAFGGAVLALAALRFPRQVPGSFQPFRFNDAGRLAGGVIFVLWGTTWAALRLYQRPRPLPKALEAEGLLGALSSRRRAFGAASAWTRVALVTLYGCFLLSRIGGVPQ